MTMLSTLKTTGRAALVALGLGATAIGGAMPVQAQSEPSFNFQLGLGNDGSVMGFDLNQRGRDRDRGKWRPIRKCLTDRQVERGLDYYGFDDADVVRKLGKSRVVVVAEWNRRYYSMTVDKCSGEVYDVRRLRKGYDFFDGPRRGPGFGYEKDGFSFQFNF